MSYYGYYTIYNEFSMILLCPAARLHEVGAFGFWINGITGSRTDSGSLVAQ
jgi:hypothetical protein